VHDKDSRTMTLRSTLIVASVLAVFPAATQAADLGSRQTLAPVAPAQTGYIVTVTGNVQAGPRFPGSDDMSAFFYPGIDWRRVGEPERFKAPDDGISFTLFETSAFRFGPTARVVGSRNPKDDHDFIGLHKVDWTIEGGAFLEVWPVEFLRARAEIRHGFNGHDGLVGNLGLDLVQHYGAFTFSIGPRLALGDSDFTREYFGITPEEAFDNGRVTAFRPDGGITSVGGLAAITYKWSEQWSTTVYGGYDRLVDDAGRSPVTRVLGSRDQWTVGASLSYSFYFPGLF
jgi:outer membrane scaffolding protein for murein synthesis (MipA/OmpV family)